MVKKANNIFLIVILAIISLTIISALIIQYCLGHEPCKLCLYERIPYFLSVLLIIKILFIKKYEKITLLILSLVFFGSLFNLQIWSKIWPFFGKERWSLGYDNSFNNYCNCCRNLLSYFLNK